MNQNDRDLRTKLIRLAHTNPDLRPSLLPLLKKSTDSFPVATFYEDQVENLAATMGAVWNTENLTPGLCDDLSTTLDDLRDIVQGHAAQLANLSTRLEFFARLADTWSEGADGSPGRIQYKAQDMKSFVTELNRQR
jgi:hypothetical protein